MHDDGSRSLFGTHKRVTASSGIIFHSLNVFRPFSLTRYHLSHIFLIYKGLLIRTSGEAKQRERERGKIIEKRYKIYKEGNVSSHNHNQNTHHPRDIVYNMFSAKRILYKSYMENNTQISCSFYSVVPDFSRQSNYGIQSVCS